MTKADASVALGAVAADVLPALLENTGNPVVILDPLGRVIEFNRACRSLTGFGADEVVGQLFWDILVPETDVAEFKERFDRHMSSAQKCEYTSQWIDKDGKRQTIEWVDTVVRGEGGDPKLVVATGVAQTDGLRDKGVFGQVDEADSDVTETTRAVSRLAASEGRFKALVDSMTDGFAIADPDDNLTFVNPALCRMLDYGREQLLGRPLSDHLDSVSREKLWEHSVQRSLDPNACTDSYELKVKRADGSFVELLVSPQRMLNEDHEYAGSFAVLTDISHIKHMERSQLLLGTAIEQAAESVVITDVDGNIQYVNPAFERASGYSSDEVIGGNPRILKSGKHDDGFYRDLWETITRGSVWTGQFTNIRRDGTLYQEEATISPVRGDKGTIVAFVAVKRDVSVERQLVEQLNRAQKLEALGELAGGVAHGLNNLLLTISGAAELLRIRQPELDGSGSELETIRETVVQGADLIRHLLSVAQQQVIEMVAINLDNVIKSELEICRSLLPASIAVEFSPSETSVLVLGDRGLLAQVLLNLCINSRDAMPDGGTLTVEIESTTADALLLAAHATAKEGRYARLRVEDNGVGMESEVRDRAFDPFFTTKKGSQGSGMGLAMVYGIVRQHHGMVEIESMPGMGTRVDIYLPLTSKPIADTAPKKRHAAVGGDETILVVEDEERVRRTQVKMLEALGYTVIEAENGRIALEVIDRADHPIDLILSDVSMPEMGGQELYDQALRLHPELAFVFTSGYTGSNFLDRFQDDEAVHFLPKPHTISELAEIVRRALSDLE